MAAVVDPHALYPVTTYVLVVVGAKATPLLSVGLHEYDVAPLAVSITVLVGQIPEDALAVFTMDMFGTVGSTEMVMTADVVQLDGLVAVNEYKVVDVGDTVIEEADEPVLQE